MHTKSTSLKFPGNTLLMKYFFLLFFLLIQISCTGVNEYSDEPFIKTNFDNLSGWVSHSNLVYGNAYSGSYSMGVDSVSEYSLIWKRHFLKLSNKSLAKLRVSAYAKETNEENHACIVISIDSDKKNLYWEIIDFKNFKLSTQSWKKVESFIEIPAVSDSAAQISIYLWGKEGSAAVIDDIEIEFAI